MKTLLAILLSFVISEAPVLAIHGGYSLGGNASLIGTYAGVLIPTGDTLLSSTTVTTTGQTFVTGTSPNNTFGTDNLGLFTLNVPDLGPTTGLVVIFTNGRTFNGSILGLPDPENSSAIKGIVDATFTFNVLFQNTTITNGVATTTVSTVAVAATASGDIDVAASSAANPTSLSPTGVELSGSSELAVDQGTVNADGSPDITEVLSFDVEGFQQTSSPTTAVSTLPTTGIGAAGGGTGGT